MWTKGMRTTFRLVFKKQSPKGFVNLLFDIGTEKSNVVKFFLVCSSSDKKFILNKWKTRNNQKN